MEIILGKTRYVVIDNVLYHLAGDKSLRIVLPKEERFTVFKKVHQGKFAEMQKSSHASQPLVELNNRLTGGLTCARTLQVGAEHVKYVLHGRWENQSSPT